MSPSSSCLLGSLFESLQHSGGPFVEDIHAQAYQALLLRLREPSGGIISLRAPRAGYGKTALLGRVGEKLDHELYFVPFTLAGGRVLNAELLLEELFCFLEEPALQERGKLPLTRLDHIARRLFARGLAPMVEAGQVPCQDQAAALESLVKRPIEAFDFHQQGAAIAQWTKAQFPVLGPRLSSSLSRHSKAPNRLVSRWLELLLNYATHKPGDLTRSEDIFQNLFRAENGDHSRSSQLEMLSALLSLITLVQPTVLVLDEVDGLSGDVEAALAVASTLVFLNQSSPQLKCILSVNQDVWDSAFLPNLPNGLRDRFDDFVVCLQEISEEEALLLVNARIKDGSFDQSSLHDLTGDEYYPRKILKQARTQSPVTKAVLTYPPKSLAAISLPPKGPIPQYKEASSYPPQVVSPITPPARQSPPVYLNQGPEELLPMPLPIAGEGFALFSETARSPESIDPLAEEIPIKLSPIVEPSSPFAAPKKIDDDQSLPFAET